MLIFDIGTPSIPNNLNEFCGALNKLFDFEFWDRGFDPNSLQLFYIVLYSIFFIYEIGFICINK